MNNFYKPLWWLKLRCILGIAKVEYDGTTYICRYCKQKCSKFLWS